nr:putative ribonuclease H-like domain-containing protein [Tanacetum cinerariifolium]
IALPNWVHNALLESSSSKPQDGCSPEVLEGNGNINPTASITNPPADQIETLTVETSIPTVSSPVLTACLNDSLEPSCDVRKNKKDERGIVVRNKARLVAQGHTQEEGIEYDEVRKNKNDERGIVVRNKARLVAQGHTQEEVIEYDEMDVKSAFLYSSIDEEVYVMQPPGFQDSEFPAKVYKVEKAMYRLHQAPRAWYGSLSKCLLMNGFQRGTIDQTLFIRRQRGDFILVQVYVDDIIFGSSNPQLCREFEALSYEKFQMSAMGELNFFLGLQVLQKKDGIFLSQDKYVGDILKKFGYTDVRSSNTHMDKENPWGKDGTGKDVDSHLYRSI